MTTLFHRQSGPLRGLVFIGALAFMYAVWFVITLVLLAISASKIEHSDVCFASNIEISPNHGCTVVFGADEDAARNDAGETLCYHVQYTLAPRQTIYGGVGVDQQMVRGSTAHRFYIETGTHDAAKQLATTIRRIPFACSREASPAGGYYQTRSVERGVGAILFGAFSLLLSIIFSTISIGMGFNFVRNARILATAHDYFDADSEGAARLRAFARSTRDNANFFVDIILDHIGSRSSGACEAGTPSGGVPNKHE